MKINEFVKVCHENAKNKGFWDKPRKIGTIIVLIHSEVTEALDADSCADFCEELADICIKIGDLCGGLEIDLESAILSINNQAEVRVNNTSFDSLEKSLIVLPPDFDDNKHACEVNRALSYALESDRKGDKETFKMSIGFAFINALIWAAQKGFSIEQNIMDKMERNKIRPKLHGKQY